MRKSSDPGIRFVRTTISLPSHLKERMDNEAPDVNWSHIATAAFEKKLDEIVVAKKQDLSLEAVVSRLRGSKRSRIDVVKRQGRQLGQDWAKRKAQIDELQQFEDQCSRMTSVDWKEISAGKRGEPIAYKFIRWLDPRRFSEHEYRDHFWSHAGADEELIAKQQFVEGFIEGVLDVWNQVRPLVLDE